MQRSGVREKELLHYVQLTAKVCDNARRRVLLGEAVANEEKIFSIFEPHTELIKRGKQPNPIQFGHNVLVIEDAVGFICHYEVVATGGSGSGLGGAGDEETAEAFGRQDQAGLV